MLTHSRFSRRYVILQIQRSHCEKDCGAKLLHRLDLQAIAANCQHRCILCASRWFVGHQVYLPERITSETIDGFAVILDLLAQNHGVQLSRLRNIALETIAASLLRWLTLTSNLTFKLYELLLLL